DDLHRQVPRRAQHVADCLVVERVHDVVSTAHQLFAHLPYRRTIEVAAEANVDDGYVLGDETRVMRMFGGTDYRDRDTGPVQADEHRERRPVIALYDIVIDAEYPDRHRFFFFSRRSPRRRKAISIQSTYCLTDGDCRPVRQPPAHSPACGSYPNPCLRPDRVPGGF